MRVLHVTSTFPRSDGDFTGTFIAGLCAAEQDAGLEVRVVAPHAPGVAGVGGLSVRRFRYGPGRAEVLAYRGGLLAAARSPAGAAMVPAYLVAMTAAAVAEARAWRPDVVHAHWWFPGGVAGAVASQVTGRPLVVTLHGSDVALAGRAVAPVARAVLRRSAAVVAVSDALAAEAVRAIGLPAGSVGVAAMPVSVGPAERRRVSGGPARVVAVGRLAAEKGFDILVEAAALAAGRGVALDVEVVGAGPRLESLRQQAAARGAPVRFPGPLAPGELHERMGAADVVVVPSRREGLGLVAVEAVLLGTPVIASHTGGLPGVLGAGGSVMPVSGTWAAVDGGALVGPGDAEGLAAALAAAGSLAPPGALARDAARGHAPGAVAARHRQLYEEAIAGWSRGTRRVGR